MTFESFFDVVPGIPGEPLVSSCSDCSYSFGIYKPLVDRLGPVLGWAFVVAPAVVARLPSSGVPNLPPLPAYWCRPSLYI